MVRCTIYAQISGLAQKANVILMTPQWGSNSKGSFMGTCSDVGVFQSPQWGSNSKDYAKEEGEEKKLSFQSPQWGSNSKGAARLVFLTNYMFQSPQWGSNSKGLNGI